MGTHGKWILQVTNTRRARQFRGADSKRQSPILGTLGNETEWLESLTSLQMPAALCERGRVSTDSEFR